ncbi:MAG TPA: methylmalonyl-CoA mutase family protein, partial [Nannocystaceae bacterium]|nr:methylmalonyl-CoA mutase family protein [Nannocystaceae bacterium]
MTQPFTAIDVERWRAKVASTLPTAATIADGVVLAALYDGGPALSVPARVPGWACVQRIEPDVDIAVQTAELQPGDVDALWLEHGDRPALVAAVIAALPPGAYAIVDGATEIPTDLARVRQLSLATVDGAIALHRRAPHVRTWCCDAGDGDPVEQLAAVIAGALAAVHAGLPADALALRIALHGDTLVDIAKLRAARSLWHACAHRLGIAASVPIHARTRRHLGTHDDVDSHLVHATLDGFAAAVGGADTLTIERHDLRGAANVGARRWARNISHLLKSESGLDRIDDAAAGAYAIESLGDELARAAWQCVRTKPLELDYDALIAGLDRGSVGTDARWSTPEGIDVPAHPPARVHALGMPGFAPYRRGPYPTM